MISLAVLCSIQPAMHLLRDDVLTGGMVAVLRELKRQQEEQEEHHPHTIEGPMAGRVTTLSALTVPAVNRC